MTVTDSRLRPSTDGRSESEIDPEPVPLDGMGQARLEEVLGSVESGGPGTVVSEVDRLILRRRALGGGDDLVATGDPAGEMDPRVFSAYLSGQGPSAASRAPSGSWSVATGWASRYVSISQANPHQAWRPATVSGAGPKTSVR